MGVPYGGPIRKASDRVRSEIGKASLYRGLVFVWCPLSAVIRHESWTIRTKDVPGKTAVICEDARSMLVHCRGPFRHFDAHTVEVVGNRSLRRLADDSVK